MGLFDSLVSGVVDVVRAPISILSDVAEGDGTLSNTRENVKDLVDDTANAVKSVVDLKL